MASGPFGRSAMTRSWGAVSSVVLGAVVGLLTNLITAGFTWPLGAGLLVAVAAWCVLAYLLPSSPVPAPEPGNGRGSHVTTHGPNSPAIGRDQNGPINYGPPSVPAPDDESPGGGT